MKHPLIIHIRLCYWLVLLAATGPFSVSLAQTTTTPNNFSILQQRYESAQQYQAADNLVRAAAQYRIFLADTLGEIAIGHAEAGQYDEAQSAFVEALLLVPDFPMMQLEYARAALRAGHYERAGVLAQDLLQKYPGQKDIEIAAHRVYGRALVKMEKNKAAKKQFEAAVFLDPSFENGYELAVAELNLGDIDDVRRLFAEMLSSFGDTATLHMYFGQAYGNSDFQSDAVAEFEKALKKDPLLRGVHYSLAVAYLATAGDSKLSEAELALRDEIAVSPDNATAYAALGHLLATHGHGADQEQAEANLKRSTQLDSRSPDAFLYLGQFYAEQKRISEAEAALKKCISLTDDVSRNSYQVQKAHYLLSRLLMQSGNTEEASKELALSQSLMKQNLSRDQNRLSKYLDEAPHSHNTPEFSQPMQATHESSSEVRSSDAVEAFEKRMTPAIADSYNNLGAIAGSSKLFEAALIYFKRAAEWNPKLPGLDLNWGRAAFESKDYLQALAPLGHYLQAHPDDNTARRLLGLSEFNTRDYNSARSTLERLAVNRGEDPSVQYAYADALLKTGEAPAAVPILESLEQSSSVSAEISQALSEAYTDLGHRELAKGNAKEATVYLEKAMKLDPENAALKQALQQAGGRPNRN